MRYRKLNFSLLRNGGKGLVIGDSNATYYAPKRHGPRKVHAYAEQRKKIYTKAELEFKKIIRELGGGALKDKYIREWPFRNWIIDYYFYEIRLMVEIDGGYHRGFRQSIKDKQKDSDCQDAGITILRLTNQEVFGQRDILVAKLRSAYRESLKASRSKPK